MRIEFVMARRVLIQIIKNEKRHNRPMVVLTVLS